MKQRWIGLALSVALLAACEGGGGSGEPPIPPPAGQAEADDPATTQASAELGIFADVRGWIAYGKHDGIWAVNPMGGTPPDRVQLSERGPAVPLAWSSDGSKLLIDRGDQSYLGPDELVVLNSDGTETLLVRGGRYDSFSGGSFTPDGSKIVYATLTWRPEKDWQSGIYVVDTDGGSHRLLLTGGQRDYPDGTYHTAVFSPTFSPDGTHIAYVDGMGDWGNTPWVMNADGSGVRELIDQEVGHFDNLAWSADGSRLAFNALYGGGVLIFGVDGSGLTTVDGKDVQWSPTGSQLAFQAGSFSSAGLWGGEGIWVMNADGSGRRQVVPLGREPVWSPDGSRIAYLGHGGLLYVADRDGTHLRTLGNLSPPRPNSVAWNPLLPSAS